VRSFNIRREACHTYPVRAAYGDPRVPIDLNAHVDPGVTRSMGDLEADWSAQSVSRSVRSISDGDKIDGTGSCMHNGHTAHQDVCGVDAAALA
jgi:hypothetical protein